MDEELIELRTEDTIYIDTGAVVQSEVLTEDLEQDVSIDEEIELVEVEDVDEIEIEIEESIGWVGGDSSSHYSLYDREMPDQHPISAITGLRRELDDIEALGVVYSDKRNHANYYLWEDENIIQENRVGYFVSACSDIDKIKLCTSDNAIFGVTVDGAGFIGAQDDIARDIKYGLVVSNGVVHIRCESDVAVGDYIVSNEYGYAKRNKSGYKVVGLHNIDGVGYAEITLVTPIDVICKLDDGVEDLNTRMDDAETNIVAAMNVANAAYNKASDAGNVSEEAIKNALEALGKADDAVSNTDKMGVLVSSANEAAAQAKAIAESAAVSAGSIGDEAKKIADESLTNVNNLIKDLEPIIEWSDPETGNTGAEYFTAYVKNGVATKAEIQTAETLIQDNKSAIEKSATEFSSFVSSVDKYSVGEYSQAYGLTYEQAKSILKVGMIYIPVDNENGNTHIEKYDGQDQDNEFTKHNYYEWNGEDWYEYSNSVVFFSDKIEPSPAITYWYIDSNFAPDGYEAHALYINQDGQWVKVNTLSGNVNNRITSMIKQTSDEISAEVVNARGSAATLGARISDTESTVQTVAEWKLDVENDVSNIATIKQTADAAGASVAQVAAKICGEYTTIEVDWDEQDKEQEKVYYTEKDKKYWYFDDGEWKNTPYPTEAGLEVDAASIVTAINDSGTIVKINADHIDIEGRVTFSSLDKTTQDKVGNSVTSTTIEYALSDSYTSTPTSGWSTTAPQWQENKYMWQRTTIAYTDTTKQNTVTTTCIQGAKGNDGKDGTGVAIKGTAYVKNVTVDDSIIGLLYDLYIDSECTTRITSAESGDAYLVDGYLFVYSNDDQFACAGRIQGPKGDQGLQGLQGPRGEQGIQGDSSYFHIKYSENPDGYPMCENPSTYIGTYVDNIEADSDDYTKYNWSRFEGVQGKEGIPGKNGENGQTSYLHIKYSNVPNPTSDQINDESGDYIGQYTDFVGQDSDDPSKYKWSKIKGESGADGYGVKVFNTTYQQPQNILDAWAKETDGVYGFGNMGEENPGESVKVGDTVWFRVKNTTKGRDAYIIATIKEIRTNEFLVKALGLLDSGDNGASGVSVSGVVTRYIVKTTSSGVPDNNDGGWSTDFDGILAYYQQHLREYPDIQLYIWTQEMVTYSNGNIEYSTATCNSASSVVAKWCDANDTTKINGAHIATGTIDANKINVNDLNAFGATIGGWSINDSGLYSYQTVDGIEHACGLWKYNYHVHGFDGATRHIAMHAGSSSSVGEAPFRVYYDGTLVSSKGHIAGLTIATGGLHISNYEDNSGCGIWSRHTHPLNDDYVAMHAGTDSYHIGDAPFLVYHSGHLVATSAEIRGHIEATSGSFRGILSAGTVLGSGGKLKFDTWPNGNGRIVTSDNTMGITFGNNTNSTLLIYGSSITLGETTAINNNGLHINTTGGTLQGTWYGTSSQSSVSDKNKKHEIETLPSQYFDLLDNLNPVRYKYNDGTSNRYHTGFIAQEVHEALKTAYIDSKDFAGLVIFNQGEEDELWTLRYEEFIALNTAAIQKLKSRVAELEQIVEKLQQKEE